MLAKKKSEIIHIRDYNREMMWRAWEKKFTFIDGDFCEKFSISNLNIINSLTRMFVWKCVWEIKLHSMSSPQQQ